VDKISTERIRLLHPLLGERLVQLAYLLSLEGVDIRVVQGGRTWKEQDVLYAKGRTVPPIGKKFAVTNAKGGESWHNYFMAADVAPDDPDILGWQPDWHPDHPSWKRIVEVGTDNGLVSGVSFHDLPHLQLTGRFPVSPTDEVRQLFRDGGIQAVWQESGLPLAEAGDHLHPAQINLRGL